MIRLVDTPVLIPASRGEQAVASVLASVSRLYIPQTVIGEFLVGVVDRPEAEASAGERWLSGLLSGADVLSPDLPISRGYARIWRHTRRAGRPIPQNDVWIAATAIHGLTLLT